MNRRLLNYTPDMEFLEHAEAHLDPAPAEPHAVMALSAGLLEVADQAELKVFLTDLVASVAATGRRRIAAPLRQALVDALYRVARPIVPIHSAGDGELRFGSTPGSTPGSAPGSAASVDLNPRAAHLFGMELEGLSPEDKEYEVAQQFIRLAADTIGHAGAARSNLAPQAVAGAALQRAARRYAPGLLQAAPPAPSQTQTGHWRRQGRRIVVFNC